MCITFAISGRHNLWMPTCGFVLPLVALLERTEPHARLRPMLHRLQLRVSSAVPSQNGDLFRAKFILAIHTTASAPPTSATHAHQTPSDSSTGPPSGATNFRGVLTTLAAWAIICESCVLDTFRVDVWHTVWYFIYLPCSLGY